MNLWRFRVKQERLVEFIEIYGADGTWAQLMSRSEAYRGTRLWQSLGQPRDFFTVDRWTSEGGFDEFKAKFASEYEELDGRCGALTEHEESLGWYRATGGDQHPGREG